MPACTAKKMKMKRTFVLLTTALLISASGLFAQKANTDSLRLVSAISKDQLKLGQLQNTVPDKTKEKTDAAQQAQASADQNQKKANELSGDPQNKKLARQADNAAGQAKRDARRARKAAANLDDLNKDISKLQDKISKEQTKLNKYSPAGMGTAAPVAAQSQADSTRH